jgi:alanine racemase
MTPARVMAVVKADAYGHGLVEISKAAVEAGVEMLGVLDIETGLALRKAGVRTPSFAWLHSPQSNFDSAVKADIELSVSSLAELKVIAAAHGTARVHLKIDTGLSRNGCRVENWSELVAASLELQSQGNISVVAIWSHLAGASKEEDLRAIALFETAYQIALAQGFSGYRHIAASPAAFSLSESRFEMVRIGVSAFGTSPVDGVAASEFGLASPMSVVTEVIAEGIIAIGFLHGFFSQLGGKTHVVIDGVSYQVLEVGPLATRIELGEYALGSTVEVFGGNAISAEDLCEIVNTVTDELFTGLKTDSVTYST